MDPDAFLRELAPNFEDVMKEAARYMSADKILFAAELAERIADLRAEENRIWRQMMDGKPTSEEMVDLIFRKHAIVLEHNLMVKGDTGPGVN